MNFCTVRNFLRRGFLVGAAALAASGCSGPEASREQQVRAVIEEAQRSAEARDLAAAMELVSDAYSDRSGRDKAQLKNLVRGYFVLNQSIHLALRVDDLQFPAEELAKARILVGMLGTRAPAEDWSLAVDVQEFEVELLREGSEWKLLHAERRERML